MIEKLKKLRKESNLFLEGDTLTGVELVANIGVSFAEISALTGKADSHLRRLGNKNLPGYNLMKLFELANDTKGAIDMLKKQEEIKSKRTELLSIIGGDMPT